jgi:hypothetical protein
MTTPFLVISQWNNNVDWVTEYSLEYVIYDKSNTLSKSDRVIKVDNVGHNLFDIFHFIYTNYENLPEMVAFLEGNPFDHCNAEKLKRLLQNKFFTSLESYESEPEYQAAIKCSDSGWMEINNSWYISSHPNRHISMFQTYNEMLDHVFVNATKPQWIRFAPGGQYLVEKSRMLYYPREWWYKLMMIVSRNANQPEAYIFERMLWTIFSCVFEARL